MTNKKSTKRALLASVIALMLCVAMLAGTTYAWFTDSVTSANNIIKSGNLDVTLEYYDVEAKVWKDVQGSSEILDANALWEPGYTDVVYLKLANAGSLALKYNLGVNIVSETAGVNAAGEEFLLSDYIMYDVIEDVNPETDAYESREEAIAAATDSEKISVDYLKSGDLASDAEAYIAMVVYMPTGVGNVANHNGTNIPEINLGINVFATQMTSESDSYGPDYDEGVVYTDFIVTNEEELKAALAEAGEFAVIGIKGNVTWTTGAGIGSTPFIEDATTYTTKAPVKNITLVGLEEGATFTAVGKGVGAIGIDGGTVTFKNLKIVDESVSYAENNWEYGYLEFRGNTVFENCDIVNAIMMEGDSAIFKNCAFNSYDDNQYAVWVSDGNATFENCYITGARGIKIHEAYGSLVDTVIIRNNQFIDLTKKPGLAIGDVDADTTVVVQNNTFAGTQAGDQGLYIYETDTDVTTFDFVCADNIVAGYADTNTELKDQLQNNATVVLPEGEYSLPSMSGKEGITIIGAADGSTVVGGNTSTGFGGNFGKNTTIKNVTFTGASNGVRYSYAQGGTSTFENCTFAGDSTYGFHMDESDGATFIFNNCTFSGFNAFAGDLEKVIFNNCTFLHNGNYGHTNIWSVAEFNNCTWGEGATYGPRGDAVIYIDGALLAMSTDALQAAINSGETKILLGAGEFTADLYVVPANRNLTITGQGAATKLNFSNQQVRLALFDSLTISNCTIGRMVDKSWGQLVFGSSTVADGVYTISNCIFNGESTQGIYINQDVAATFNIENCTFNGDFGGEGAITIQDNNVAGLTVNVTGCSFNNIPATSHEIAVLFTSTNVWTLNAEGVTVWYRDK